MWQVVFRELNKILLLDLKNVIVIDVSGDWINLINDRVVLWSVWEVISSELDEILTGDWSSDVCSSDLPHGPKDDSIIDKIDPVSRYVNDDDI